ASRRPAAGGRSVARRRTRGRRDRGAYLRLREARGVGALRNGDERARHASIHPGGVSARAMTGKGIAVALGLGALGALALMTGRRPPHRRDPSFPDPMVPPPPGPPEEHPVETTPLTYEEARK